MDTSGSAGNGPLAQARPDGQVWQGVSLMLDQYLHLNDADRVLILYTRSARTPAAWVAAELDIRGVPTAIVDLDALTETTIEQFAAKLRRSLDPDKIIARLLVLCIEYDVVTPSAWIRRALEPFSGTRIETFRTIMTGEDFFRQGVTTPPATLNNINAGLLRTLRSPSGSGSKRPLDRNWISPSTIVAIVG